MPGKEVIPLVEGVKKIEAACLARKDDAFAIIARTDALAVEGIDGTLRRARAYAEAGADLIFADAIRSEEQVKRLVDAARVPVTVNMGFGIRSRPTTPLMSLKRLAEIGVRRVTLPRMLPAAAIMGMTRALEVMKEVVGDRRAGRPARPRGRHRGHHAADGLRRDARAGTTAAHDGDAGGEIRDGVSSVRRIARAARISP